MTRVKHDPINCVLGLLVSRLALFSPFTTLDSVLQPASFIKISTDEKSIHLTGPLDSLASKIVRRELCSETEVLSKLEGQYTETTLITKPRLTSSTPNARPEG